MHATSPHAGTLALVASQGVGGLQWPLWAHGLVVQSFSTARARLLLLFAARAWARSWCCAWSAAKKSIWSACKSSCTWWRHPSWSGAIQLRVRARLCPHHSWLSAIGRLTIWVGIALQLRGRGDAL